MDGIGNCYTFLCVNSTIFCMHEVALSDPFVIHNLLQGLYLEKHDGCYLWNIILVHPRVVICRSLIVLLSFFYFWHCVICPFFIFFWHCVICPFLFLTLCHLSFSLFFTLCYLSFFYFWHCVICPFFIFDIVLSVLFLFLTLCYLSFFELRFLISPLGIRA